MPFAWILYPTANLGALPDCGGDVGDDTDGADDYVGQQ